MTAPNTTVACPQCGGAMWDNRLSKRNPKAPDFKCRDRTCDGAIWPPRDGAAAAAQQDTPAVQAAKAAIQHEPAAAPVQRVTQDPYQATLPPAQPLGEMPTSADVAARTAEHRAAKKRRIDIAAAHAAAAAVEHVLPILAKAPTTAGDLVVTVDIGAITASILDAYTKAGIV